jgi:hypothetical protein
MHTLTANDAAMLTPSVRQHPVTAGAGRADDPGDAGGMQRFDEPRDRPQWRQVALPGQQPGAVLQRPGQFLLI